jgi:hypothetical protein
MTAIVGFVCDIAALPSERPAAIAAAMIYFFMLMLRNTGPCGPPNK